jgi:peptidyl-prolyl cis-trans isomerase B (cyclophilin B)
VTALLLVSHTPGCKRQPAAPEAPEQAAPAPVKTANPEPSTAPADPRWHQPFTTATRPYPPPESQRPPDTTVAGRSSGKLHTEVVRIWDSIRFMTPEGKSIHYRAVLDIDGLGTVEMDLHPEWAPNHVRNFVALARVGYYDGLQFERIVHEEDEEGKTVVDSIEAGCPLGTGKFGYGSIGYWLKEEFSSAVHHEEGTVGACRLFEPDTAACRFYITLGKAPTLDGNYTVFGKVTKGLDVVRKVFQEPVRRDDEDPELSNRPVKPLIIRKVTIQTALDP